MQSILLEAARRLPVWFRTRAFDNGTNNRSPLQHDRLQCYWHLFMDREYSCLFGYIGGHQTTENKFALGIGFLASASEIRVCLSEM